MTHAIPYDSQPIRVRLGDRQEPVHIAWLGREHRVERVSKTYCVPDGSIEAPILRDYFEITTTSGWLMSIYHDLVADDWRLETLYD